MACGKLTRLGIVLGMTIVYFFVEIVVGYTTNSLALIADAFHMLSDIIALFIGMFAIKIAKQVLSSVNTYGWIRAEVLGALMNGVFLAALSISILISTIERFIKVEEIEDPKLLLIVGGIGLMINGIGLGLFSGGHGHSHGGSSVATAASEVGHGDVEDEEGDATEETGKKKKAHGHAHDHNARGVFLHLLGDAMGSVAVCVSALVVWLTDWKYKHYLDPCLGLLIALIVLVQTVPLIKRTAFILLQGVPETINLEEMRDKIIEFNGVADVHELHVWQLTDDKLIASVHVIVQSQAQYMEIATQLKAFFHEHGIHSTTIQPEFVDNAANDGDEEKACLLNCASTTSNVPCAKNVCCTDEKVGLTRRRRPFEQVFESLKIPSPRKRPDLGSAASSPQRTKEKTEEWSESSNM